MPDIAKIAAVSAKLGLAEGAEPAHEDPSASPDVDTSGAGSAPAAPSVEESAPSVSDDAGDKPREASSPGLDHKELAAKLEADRDRRRTKEERKRAKLEREQAEKERQQLEADRKEAAAEKAKWENLGKGKSWLETIKESGRNPLEVFEEMKAEA